MRACSVSPLRRRNEDHHYGSDYVHLGGPSRDRGFGPGRDSSKSRDLSPPYSRGRNGSRSFRRDLGRPGFVPGMHRGESMHRNNPNVRPRQGDWYCTDPMCGNLNFARRDYCNNCRRSRPRTVVSPRRGYPGPPPPPPPPVPRRIPGPPLERSSGRSINGYRSPPSPRGWSRDGAHDLRGGGGPPHSRRHESRFLDQLRRDRLDYPELDLREKNRFDRPPPPLDWIRRDHRGRDGFPERRRSLSPLLSPPPPIPPHHGRWTDRDLRARSRSPIPGGLLAKDYSQNIYMERGRGDRRRLIPDGDDY